MPSSVPNRKPVQSFPTPEVLDSLVWEKVEYHANSGERLQVGKPHPDRSKFPGLILVAEKPVDGTDSLVIRWWSSQYQNQDLYNYSENFQSESPDHPSWARRYLVRRDKDRTLFPFVRLQAFTGVYLISVTNEGQDYATDPVVTISGGGGTGATAQALRTDDGKIAWIRIVTEGTGYTTTPTVTISGGGGTGATATALMQGAAKLIHQEIQPLPQDDPRYSTFVTVLRVWETLPGPELIGKVLNTETGILDSVYEQVDVYGTDPENGEGVTSASSIPIDANRTRKKWVIAGIGPTLDLENLENVVGWRTHMDKDTLADFYKITALAEKDAALPAIETGGLSTTFTFKGQLLYLVDRSKAPKNDEQDEWTLIACTFPEPYTEYPSVAIRFPGIFQFISSEFTVPFSFPYRPPFPGIHYNYLPPRTNARPARATYFFTDGLPPSIPDQFTVLSPGTESKMVPIREDTIHPALEWFIVESGSDGSVVVTQVEDIPASSPETYDPNDIYVFKVQVERWFGNIFKVTVIEASEGKGITYFPPVNRGTGVTIGSFGGGLPTADYSNSGFYAVNTEAGPFGVQLFGFRGPTWTRIQGTTGTDAGLVNLGSGVLNTLEYITGDGTNHSEGVEVYSYGDPGTATITFSSNPANNDQIRLGFLNGDAAYNTVWTFKTTLSQNVRATGTLTISGIVLDAQTVTIGTRVYEYDSHSTETITSGNVRADISPATGFTVASKGTISVDGGLSGTFTIGAKVFTLVAPGTNVNDGDVVGSATASTLATNIVAAINGTDGVNTVHPTVACGGMTNDGSGTYIAILSARAGGVAGNSIGLSSTTGSINFDDTTLGNVTAGVDCTAANAVTALVTAITGDASALVSAVDGTGNTVDVTSLIGGTAANYATTETMTNGSWGAATLTGGVASAAYEVQRGATSAESAYNLQLAINGSGTVGTNYSTGTAANTIIEVPTETEAASFTAQTIIGADWESFGSWQTGGNFEWITDANGAFPVNDFGTVTALTGATNGTLLGTLEEVEHSLVMNFQDFDDSQLKERNFPPTPDDLTTSVVHVGNRDAQIWFGHFGGMPLKYQKSVDGVTNWIDGAINMNATNVYPPQGAIRKLGITDFADAQPYRYIRFIISPSSQVNASQDYGIGKVSRLYLSVVWALS